MPQISVEEMVAYATEVPRIASWFYEEWRSFYGEQSLASVQHRIESWLTRDKIPTALVAICDGQVIGTVALKEKELEQFSYSPWLAGVFVLPEFRSRGVGALLIDAAEKKAKSLGVSRLFLYTPSSETYYETLGWQTLVRHELAGEPITIMAKDLR